MKVREVLRMGERREELEKFFASRPGLRFVNLEWHCFVEAENFHAFCDCLANYANSKEGPACSGRLELFAGTHEMFEKGNEVGGSETKRHYNLDKSFIGDDEANLMLLKEAHRGLAQHEIADLLGCSRTSVQKRLSKLADGVRFADSFIKVEPSGRGALKSTMHPIFLPLRLSEVYLLICALEDFVQRHPENDAESELADGLARRVYAQLSAYGQEGIKPSLEKRGIAIRGEAPDFDSKLSMSDSERIIMYDKMNAKFKVEIKGEELVGRYVRGAKLQDCANAEEGFFGGSYFIMELEDGSLRAVDWGQITSMGRSD